MSNSSEAYKSVIGSLPDRWAAVMRFLRYFHDTQGHAPTSSELDEFSRLVIKRSHKRLPECATAGLVHKGPSRTCTISGRTACTWNLGPEPEQGELW